MRLAQREPALTRLRSGIRHLSPGYFALVMATGIVSVAVGSAGHDGTWVAFAAWAALFAAMLASLTGFPRSHHAPGQRSA